MGIYTLQSVVSLAKTKKKKQRQNKKQENDIQLPKK